MQVKFFSRHLFNTLQTNYIHFSSQNHIFSNLVGKLKSNHQPVNE